MAKSTHPKVTLHYFPTYGRAEPIRMLMAHVGMEFENVKVPGTEWGALKAKVGGGGMPIMEWPDGKMMQ